MRAFIADGASCSSCSAYLQKSAKCSPRRATNRTLSGDIGEILPFGKRLTWLYV
jgi:hypothetical protein